MGKQAVAMYATNASVRFDSTSASLDYPQRPLVSTEVSRAMGFDELASGANAVVAIMSLDGYNQAIPYASGRSCPV